MNTTQLGLRLRLLDRRCRPGSWERRRLLKVTEHQQEECFTLEKFSSLILLLRMLSEISVTKNFLQLEKKVYFIVDFQKNSVPTLFVFCFFFATLNGTIKLFPTNLKDVLGSQFQKVTSVLIVSRNGAID